LTQGVAHVEFAFTDRGPVLFELGARCGGGHTPQIANHVSGVNEFVEACRMAFGMTPNQFHPTRRAGADYRFLVFATGIVKEVTIPETLRGDRNIVDVGVTLRPGDTIRSLRSTVERAGFVVSIGETLEEAVERADDACRQISIRYADGTTSQACELQPLQECVH